VWRIGGLEPKGVSFSDQQQGNQILRSAAIDCERGSDLFIPGRLVCGGSLSPQRWVVKRTPSWMMAPFLAWRDDRLGLRQACKTWTVEQIRLRRKHVWSSPIDPGHQLAAAPYRNEARPPAGRTHRSSLSVPGLI
jgi:hypothetical protein